MHMPGHKRNILLDNYLEKLSADMQVLEDAKARYESDLVELNAEEKNLQHRIKELQAYRAEKNSQRGETILRMDEIGRQITELYIRISETQTRCWIQLPSVRSVPCAASRKSICLFSALQKGACPAMAAAPAY